MVGPQKDRESLPDYGIQSQPVKGVEDAVLGHKWSFFGLPQGNPEGVGLKRDLLSGLVLVQCTFQHLGFFLLPHQLLTQ